MKTGSTLPLPREISAGRLTLKKLAEYPIVTYALTARDSDVIKTYVRIGLGVEILAKLAVDPATDSALVVLHADHLLAGHATWFGFRRDALLRASMYDFIHPLASNLPEKLVRAAARVDTPKESARILAGVRIPLRDSH
jgi:LysR family cys regulon transcriptional activator